MGCHSVVYLVVGAGVKGGVTDGAGCVANDRSTNWIDSLMVVVDSHVSSSPTLLDMASNSIAIAFTGSAEDQDLSWNLHLTVAQNDLIGSVRIVRIGDIDGVIITGKSIRHWSCIASRRRHLCLL